MTQNTPEPSSELRIAQILWAALFASTLVYVAILELVEAQSTDEWQALAPVFIFGGVGAAVASLLVPTLVKRAQGAYLVRLILSLAFAESVSILGFVLGFLGAPVHVAMPFFVVSWFLMIPRFPTREKLDREGRSS